MKSNFALSLSFEGIRLLHRAAGGWRLVGDVSLDAADMAADLALLHDKALLLEPAGLRTKILLPAEQIKYLTIETEEMDDSARMDAARAALDGATPYAVDDLAFDICADGAQTHIAAVARETLAEAEAFAVEHEFDPVNFAAVPGDHPYLGAPFFGETAGAAKVLKGEPFEHDDIAVVVIGKAEIPEVPADAPPVTPEVALEPIVADKSADAPEPGVAAAKDTKLPVQPVAPPLPETAQKPAAETPVAKPPPSSPPPAPDTPPAIAADKPSAVATVGPSVAAPAKPVSAKPVTVPAKDVVPPPVPPISAEPPPMADAPPAGFASRRAAAPDSSAQGNAPSVRAQISADTSKNAAPALTASYANVSIPPSPPKPEPVPVAAKPARGGFLSRHRSKKPQETSKPVTAINEPRRTPEPGASEAERMTVFGARSGDVRGKPRFLGLMLTAALLLFLAGVAAWASVFLDDGINLSRFFGERSKPEFSTAPDPEPIIVETAKEPPVVTASLDPTLSPEDSAVLDALRTPLPAPDLEELSEAELEAKYAATGFWPRAPQAPPEPAGAINLDDLYLTGIDPVSSTTDAVALPASASFGTDIALGVISSPAAAGTAFALGTDGLVVPTVQGTLSPDGFMVFLGRPDITPPIVPTRFQSEPEDTAVRSTLAAARPEIRPETLSETYQRAQLDGLTLSELASLRPALRPTSLQERVAALAVPTPEPIATDGAVQIALANPPAIENATQFAVKASVRPDTRPKNFARIVRRAERTAPTEEVRVASAAAVAPRTVSPSIPSSASVARQATVKNAINLRKINLIGVYGKPASRRALIRLGNGRYQKVTVGDRIDGGRVSAIGQDELRYTKGGRNLVLTMPNG
jgi:hypothetical protein